MPPSAFPFCEFQSTLPRRERLVISAVVPHRIDFNPRSHEGSDDNQETINRHSNISIHAPTKGATLTSTRKYWKPSISIHAPTKGATSSALMCAATTGFQSTLPRRERQTPQRDRASECHFNPRSHEGSDVPVHVFGDQLQISIHAPTKGATRTV